MDFSSSYDSNSHFNTHGKLGEQVPDVVDFGRRSTLGVHSKW